ncbi:BTAD domain-containing putative transcriptional regulator [Streptomyces sp. NPDC093071]|uniref:BTAD domain-containing putative transcriptional regulator n=1 Tax=Streptomyces sp. NPDC093071 TaxID=3366022 RepID=UPI0038129B59
MFRRGRPRTVPPARRQRGAGRRGEALQAYQSLYRILRSEPGLEPSAELQRLQS